MLIGLAGAHWPMVAHPAAWARDCSFAIFIHAPLPYVRKRMKDLPVLKTFIAPVLIATVLVFWPVLELRRSLGLREILIFFWCLIILSVNSLSFDLRDIEGDLRTGTKTAAVLLGTNWSVVFLGALAFAGRC